MIFLFLSFFYVSLGISSLNEEIAAVVPPLFYSIGFFVEGRTSSFLDYLFLDDEELDSDEEADPEEEEEFEEDEEPDDEDFDPFLLFEELDFDPPS